MLDRPFDVAAGGNDGVHVAHAERQVCRDRRGKRAPRPVRMLRRKAWAGDQYGAFASAGNVDAFGAVEVSSLHKNDAGTELEDPPASFAHVADRPDLHPRQHFGFRNVGSHDVRLGQELGADRLHRFGVQQAVSCFCHHHRIDDELRQLEALDRRGHRFDDGGICQHAGLDGVDADVFDDGLDLRGDQIGGERDPVDDAEGVLRRDRGNCAHAVHAMCGERFQIGLNASARTRVTAGDCQYCTHTLEFAVMRSDSSATTLVSALGARTDSSVATRIAGVLFIAALTAAAAQVSFPVPFTPVPLVLQDMIVLIGGAALGSRLAMAAQLVYLAAGIAGLPVFAASATLPQGPLRFLGPTGGYLISYPFAAFLTGYLAERGFDRRFWTSVVAMAAGLVVIFAFGVTWMALFMRPAGLGFDAALRAGFYPFLLGDVFKICFGAAALPGLWRLIGKDR